MKGSPSRAIDRILSLLVVLFLFDRLLKMVAVVSFFRRTPPSTPSLWPTVTLIQPITRGASGLAANLRSRALLDYPQAVQHLLVCDAQDSEAQRLCRGYLDEFPTLHANILLVESQEAAVATKIEKFNAALLHAEGEIVCFLDDDIALRPNALRILVPYILQPRVGAVFGLACYTNWDTVWSSLMSMFVNANALLSYIPITYLTTPFTVTGHCFALRLKTLHRVGGFDGLANRIDDDHELARRVRAAGLACTQTPLIYDVNNSFDSRHAYNAQMKRWFVLPRQTMIPYLTPREQLFSLLGSIGNLLPGIMLPLALFSRRRTVWMKFGLSLGLFTAIYAWCEQRYLKRHTPLKRWLLLPIIALITPVQVLAALLSNNEIEWRGQKLRVLRGGKLEIIS